MNLPLPLAALAGLLLAAGVALAQADEDATPPSLEPSPATAFTHEPRSDDSSCASGHPAAGLGQEPGNVAADTVPRPPGAGPAAHAGGTAPAADAPDWVAGGLLLGLAAGGSAGAVIGRNAPRRGPRPDAAKSPQSPLPAPDGPRPPRPREPTSRPDPPDDLDVLAERARAKPQDGHAEFVLGVELVRRGQDDAGVQHLSHSFRTYPAGVLRLLQDPEYATVRENPHVVHALRTLHRDQVHRQFTGYA